MLLVGFLRQARFSFVGGSEARGAERPYMTPNYSTAEDKGGASFRR